MDPLTLSLIAGAGMTAYGMMKPSPQFQSPNFSDINLQNDNPALYAEIQKYSNIGNQLQAQYNNTFKGPTASDIQARDQSSNDLNHNLEARGQVGGSTSILANNQLNQNFQNQVMQRAFAERSQLANQMDNNQRGVAQMYGQGQQQAYGAMYNQNMQNYMNAQRQDQARNQFGMGLLGAGVQGYANNQNAQNMQNNMNNNYLMASPEWQSN